MKLVKKQKLILQVFMCMVDLTLVFYNKISLERTLIIMIEDELMEKLGYEDDINDYYDDYDEDPDDYYDDYDDYSRYND